MIATAGLGLDEWIIDDTCLVLNSCHVVLSASFLLAPCLHTCFPLIITSVKAKNSTKEYPNNTRGLIIQWKRLRAKQILSFILGLVRRNVKASKMNMIAKIRYWPAKKEKVTIETGPWPDSSIRSGTDESNAVTLNREEQHRMTPIKRNIKLLIHK